jgi:diguanylate cyclase (GGDEF)-like protein/PAS domain S-box-containing protein
MGSLNTARDSLALEEALHLLRLAPHAVAVLDAEGRFAWANDACARLLAWSAGAGDLLGHSWREVHDPEEAERLEGEAFAPARGGTPWRGQATARRHDGVHLPLDVILSPLGGGRLALALRDASDRRRAEEELRALVYRDPLTGLPNRRLFEDRLAIALAQAHRYRHRLAVIFLDLDRFKQVNDTLGHAAGDALLKAVSERLTESVREGDTVARLAGDEFTLLLPGIHYAEDLATISRKLVEALRQPFSIEGHAVRVTASGGISLYPEDGEEAEALLKCADTAMYRAKERGRDNFQLFSPAMAEKALERRSLEESLRRALDRQEMTLHYQPCLDLATGRVLGIEALLRWQRPELGLLEPKDFIALADFTGVMLSVGPWVLETACRQAREWQRRGSRGLRVMVNLSAHELQQPELIVHVEKALAASGLEPDTLHLEIPEGYAMQDLDRAVETLRALRAVGVHLSIDGFGAGFSSLAHLRRLPVDALKIDLSFVRGATTDPDDASIVTAVIAVAHSLGLRVVALGVETEAQVALLRSLRCDEVQGYLWSPPVAPDRCERLLAEGVLPAPSFPPRTRRGRPGRAASRRGRSGD